MERPKNNDQLKSKFRGLIDDYCGDDEAKKKELFKRLNEAQKQRLAKKLKKAIA